MDIANMRFESYSGKHAILIDTAGTYNLDNIYFDESGTNEIETTHVSGTVTINIIGGGVVPGVTITGAGSVVINNNVTISIHVTDDLNVNIENARVRIVAAESVGTITSGDVLLTGLTNSSGVLETTLFNYEGAFNPSGLDISIKARKSSGSPYKKPALLTGTITTSGYFIKIALQPD